MRGSIYYGIGSLCISYSIMAGSWLGREVAQHAVVKDPVVDLFTELPIQDHAPVASTGYADGVCRRAHQVLFNEVVTVLERQGHYVKIACDNAVYGLQDGVPLNTFWIHKKHLITLQRLADEQLAAVPGPWDGAGDTIVLRFPWEIYSASTRFVRDPELDTSSEYGIKKITTSGHALCSALIPQDVARIEQERTPAQKRACFVQSAYDVVRYAHNMQDEDGAPMVIPYVWGGSSFLQGYTDDFFLQQHNRWGRAGAHAPYYGYDCSELILRLGQACGIPLVGKTTTMLNQLLKAVTPRDALEDGDIIWCPGHVIIISDIEHNEMIEARGYKSGYGRVHCLKLSRCFRGIKNYRQLREAYFKKQPLVRLKKDGTVENVIKEFKLLKLMP